MTTPNRSASPAQVPQFTRRQDSEITICFCKLHGSFGVASGPFIPNRPFQDNPARIDDFPRGYPSLSAFMSADKDFTMFRSFSRLHTRVLLHKQDELTELEQRLDELDQADSKVAPYLLITNRDVSGDTERRALLSEIEIKLNEYKSLMAHQERPEPNEAQIRSVRNWVDGKRPIVYSETTFLNDRSDLKRSRHTIESGGLESLLDSLSTWPYLRGICKDKSGRSSDPRVKIIKPLRLVSVSRALNTLLAIATLVAPIVVLYLVKPIPMRLCIIAAFTVVFSSALCWLTSSRNYEIFSATAAYCAVMVVFVGSLPDP
ncbi:hypothetical protein HYE67_011359 [Fusarium culmorum]|uniref:DUF6594 domain-containing protein n=1 Tax=Fusarium culmorum TaxID=5516 RepID=A0A2T4GIC1_FUSCU|nr:hypothetical protein FCULG_00009090 [Fusarium culmorum]QPC69128.1 hypothetical protein HYE67_011359 [Fusarium culmorum]